MDETTRKRFRQTHLGRLLGEMSRDFSIRVKGTLAARGHRGVKPSHTQVFVALPLAGARLTTIAERAGITKQSMGTLVRELETLGYLERAPDPEDGRATIIRFSTKGLRMLDDAQGATADVEALYREKLGERRLERLKKDLAELVRALEIDIPA